VDQIIVGMADCQIADGVEKVLATYALGSCIGLALYDPQTKVGGLLHFMLPDSTIDPARGKANPYMFADTGIPLLVEQVCGRGALKRRLIVRAAGGAQMMDQENIFEIGKRNYLAMRKILWRSGVLLHAEAVGGVRSRTVRLELSTGKFFLLEGGEQRELVATSPRREGGN
jgi:chemotaxis protein CheD